MQDQVFLRLLPDWVISKHALQFLPAWRQCTNSVPENRDPTEHVANFWLATPSLSYKIVFKDNFILTVKMILKLYLWGFLSYHPPDKLKSLTLYTCTDCILFHMAFKNKVCGTIQMFF